MEAEIEKAVQIAGNPSNDRALQQQAVDYILQLRSNTQAWEAALRLFTREPRTSELTRLYSLDIVNYAIHNHNLDAQSLAYFKNTLFQYVQQIYGSGDMNRVDSAAIRNKLCQSLTYIFVFLYRSGWSTFIDDFLALTRLPGSSQPDNVPGVVMYLRILASIHDEIADMLMSRDSQEAKRNTELKDQIRAQDMQKVAQSWRDLLAHYSPHNDAIIEMILRVIGKWVSWMDISLVISQDMLSLLLPVVGRASPSGKEDKIRDAAIETLTEIVGKKMKPADKMELISFLKLREICTELSASPPLNEFKSTPQYDTDLAEALAKLVNTVMTDIVRAIDDTDVPATAKVHAEQHLQGFLPLLLRFFSDEYDEVCSTVIPSLTDLLTAIRKFKTVPRSYAEMLPVILNAIIIKMRYDESSEWADEDSQTDDAEFEDLRRKLHNLQKLIAAIDQPLYIEALSNVVGNSFQTLNAQGAQMNWRDLDLALHEMLLFGELALPNQGLMAKNRPSTAASERLVILMKRMIQSGIASYPHPAILIQYMEICVRYCSILESNHDLIPIVLENFIHLVHHNHIRIKSRSWYLFSRFVKQLRGQIGNVAEGVIKSIGDLLPIKAEVTNGDDADDHISSDESDHSADALFTSQLNLYEAIGFISSTSATPADRQAFYARSVMEPIFADMQAHLSKAASNDAQALLQIHHSIMAMGMLAPGFSDAIITASKAENKPKVAPPEVIQVFSQATEAVLMALSQLKFNTEIRQAARSTFSRFLSVMGANMLPQLPQWIDGLMSGNSTNDEIAFFLRLLGQLMHNFKGEILEILDLLLVPLVQRIHTGMLEPVTGTDDEIQLQELRREYLSFFQLILNNGLESVFISEKNQHFFETIISSVLDIARNINQNVSQSRLGFNALTRMTQIWGGPDLTTISDTPTAPSGSPQPAIPGFDGFLMERFHGLAWDVIKDAQFAPDTDAQMRQLLAEIVSLEQTLYMKIGDAYIQHVQAVLAPQLGFDATEFLTRLATSKDRKSVVQYLQQLVKSRRQ
ncbi:hypothetical protein TD95_000759 [Thielaviopsis punctulata]|uniref:Exportin-T n=1 Tax=Thielaviopsis punctulata TaxID=72032 RepID=A0A0F4Z8Z6_9PEZI|nr:hypothetical protein TD95_000759 [Thielaviopsis punctulata]